MSANGDLHVAPHYRRIWLLLCLGWIISSADRTITGPVITWMIQHKVAFMAVDKPYALGGLVGSIFFAGYMLTQFPGGAVRGAAVPGSGGIGAQLRRELAELGLGEQRGVILRVPLDGQAIAFDRVGQDDRGPAVVDGPVGLVQGTEVMAAEVADGPREGSVVKVGDKPGERLVPGWQPQAQLVRGAAE